MIKWTDEQRREGRRKALARYRGGARYRERINRNKDKIRALRAAWLKKNRRRVAEVRHNYRKNNRAKINAYQMGYYPGWAAKNRDRIAGYRAGKAWPSCSAVARRASSLRATLAISDGHVRGLLSQRSLLKASDIPPGLINVKRQHIILLRKLKEKEREWHIQNA